MLKQEHSETNLSDSSESICLASESFLEGFGAPLRQGRAFSFSCAMKKKKGQVRELSCSVGSRGGRVYVPFCAGTPGARGCGARAPREVSLAMTRVVSFLLVEGLQVCKTRNTCAVQ